MTSPIQNFRGLPNKPYLLFSLTPCLLLTLVNIHLTWLSQSACNTKVRNNQSSKLFSVGIVDSILETAQEHQQGNIAYAQTVPKVSATEPFKQAVNEAMVAAELTQTAQSSQEWFSVVSKWVKAANLMEEVPSSHPHYKIAQKKVVEYRSNWEYARQNFKNYRSQEKNNSR